jgi:hypothetical protein
MLEVIEAVPVTEASRLCPATPLCRTGAVAGCVGRGLSGRGAWLAAYGCAVDGPPTAGFTLFGEDPWRGEAVDGAAVGRVGAASLVVRRTRVGPEESAA